MLWYSIHNVTVVYDTLHLNVNSGNPLLRAVNRHGNAGFG
jgi:hypothetical protein